MRIGINLLYLIPGVVGGTETYASGLLRGMARINQQDEFVLFLNRESARWPIPQVANMRSVVCPVSASRRGKRYLYEQLLLPTVLAKHKVEIVHSLGYVSPLFASCPSVVSIPDINYRVSSNQMPRLKRSVLRFFVKKSVQRAAHVITISDFSKAEIERELKTDTARVTVTHLGPREYSDAISSGDWGQLRSRYGIREPYIVAFGGGAAHKNISRLMSAFAMVRKEFSHGLVLVGNLPPTLSLSSECRKKGIVDRVTATGYVPEEHLHPLLSRAELFVLPSLYEGFGLPVLEAQGAGVAVACSNAGSLPEVAGDGAVFFDPSSVSEMAVAIERCLSEPELRLRLISQGRHNLSRFSWKKTAMATMEVYHAALAQLR